MNIKQSWAKPKCKSCRFFVEFANNSHFGWCHRNAPNPIQRKQESDDIYFELWEPPKVRYQNWCAEHKKNEQKNKLGVR
jgi:hypothetical protein